MAVSFTDELQRLTVRFADITLQIEQLERARREVKILMGYMQARANEAQVPTVTDAAPAEPGA